jgi:hypothetical protein
MDLSLIVECSWVASEGRRKGLGEQADQVCQSLWLSVIEPVGAVRPHRDQARLAQHLQVLRHAGRGQTKALCQLARTTFAVPGLDEDAPTMAAGDGAQQFVKTLRLNHGTTLLRKNPK